MRSTPFKLIIFLLFLNFQAINTSAQTVDSLSVQLERKWVNAKVYTLKMADLMPEEFYDFKPSPEEMSFGEQLLHISNNIIALSSNYLSVKSDLELKNISSSDKTAIMKTVGNAFDIGRSAHQQVEAKHLDDMVKFFAGPLSKRQILLLLHDHQTHHVGQLIVYLRLKGIKPPAYVGW